MLFSYNQLHTKILKNCIQIIQNDCSKRCDHGPASFKKLVSEFLVSPITFIINNFPDIWKLARISSIPKIQLPVEFKVYRRVSILPILSKIDKRVVLKQIASFIEKKLIYHHYQCGYRKSHSTATLLANLLDHIKKTMKASEITLAVFTDYWKAFDPTDFSILIK